MVAAGTPGDPFGLRRPQGYVFGSLCMVSTPAIPTFDAFFLNNTNVPAIACSCDFCPLHTHPLLHSPLVAVIVRYVASSAFGMRFREPSSLGGGHF